MIMNFKRFITLLCAIVCFVTVSQAREKSVVIGVSASKPSSATETYINCKEGYDEAIKFLFQTAENTWKRYEKNLLERKFTF